MHCCVDRFHHTFDVLQHLVIPETEHAIAIRLEILGSLGVRRDVVRLIMLPAIDFNDDAILVTGEIRKVRTYRRLSAEIGALDRDASQMPPQLSLRVRHLAAEFARA
jgi:hypothetical protein